MKQTLAAAYTASLSCASQALCPSMCRSTAHACSYIVVPISLGRVEVDPAVSHSVCCDAYALLHRAAASA